MTDTPPDDSGPRQEAPASSMTLNLPPIRTRKQTVFYEPSPLSAKTSLKIPKGTGARLRDISTVSKTLAKTPSDDPLLLDIHRVLYKRIGAKRTRKRDVGDFCGFEFGTDDTSQCEDLGERIRHTNKIRKLVDFFNLPVKTGKDKMVDALVEFFLKPADEEAEQKSFPPKKEKKETPKKQNKNALPLSKKRKTRESKPAKKETSTKRSVKKSKRGRDEKKKTGTSNKGHPQETGVENREKGT